MYYLVSSHQGNKIYKVTDKGVVSTFASVPNGPHGIALHPHGYLVVTTLNDGKLYTVAMDGLVAPIPLQSPLPGPAGITCGPDGAVYIACMGGDTKTGFGGYNIGKILKLHPANLWNVETIADGLTGCGGIALDSDGDIFVTNYIGGDSTGLYIKEGNNPPHEYATATQTGTTPYGLLHHENALSCIARQGGKITRHNLGSGESAVFYPGHRILHGGMGMARLDDGTLVVANELAGTLVKVKNGSASTFTKVPKPLGIVVVP